MAALLEALFSAVTEAVVEAAAAVVVVASEVARPPIEFLDGPGEDGESDDAEDDGLEERKRMALSKGKLFF